MKPGEKLNAKEILQDYKKLRDTKLPLAASYNYPAILKDPNKKTAEDLYKLCVDRGLKDEAASLNEDDTYLLGELSKYNECKRAAEQGFGDNRFNSFFTGLVFGAMMIGGMILALTMLTSMALTSAFVLGALVGALCGVIGGTGVFLANSDNAYKKANEIFDRDSLATERLTELIQESKKPDVSAREPVSAKGLSMSTAVMPTAAPATPSVAAKDLSSRQVGGPT